MAKPVLKFLDAAQLLELVSASPLGSAGVDSRPVEAALAPDLSFGPFSALTLNLRSAVSVQALNGPEDVDADGIVAPTAGGPAWLKYRLEAGTKAEGAGSVSAVGFEFAGEAHAALLDYRAHPRNRPVREAVKADVASGPRFSFDRSDVEALGPDDAVAVRLQGRLQASVSVSWSDVFSTHLSELLSLSGIQDAVALQVEAGASLAATVSIADDFLVAFTALPGGEFRVAVRKAKQRGLSLAGSLGAQVTFADPGAVQALVESYVQGVLGSPLAQVETILGRAGTALSSQERELVEHLLDRFGLAGVAETIDGAVARIREEIAAFKAKVAKLVERVATAKIAAGFGYEYSRVDTDTVLFQALLTKAALVLHHDALKWGRIAGALADETGGVTVESYLNERTSKRVRSWGFTLGLDKWKLSGRDEVALESVTRRDQEGRLQVSYLGTRSYVDESTGSRWSWETDFNAGMASFSSLAGKAHVSEFDFGIGLLWHQSGGKLDADDLERLVDAALLWRVVDEAGANAARRALFAAAGRPYEATVQTLVGKGVFRAILPALADPAHVNAPSIAGALASAMPWWKKLRELTPSQRRDAYEGLWSFYLDPRNARLSGAELARFAARTLAKHEELEPLGLLEEKADGPGPFTFAGLTQLNARTRGQFAAFTRGLRSLKESIDNGASDDGVRIPKAFADLEGFWAQSHHVRAVGAYLLDAAEREGVLADTRRSLTVSAGGTDVIVLASA
jgi:hypothetical protein